MIHGFRRTSEEKQETTVFTAKTNEWAAVSQPADYTTVTRWTVNRKESLYTLKVAAF